MTRESLKREPFEMRQHGAFTIHTAMSDAELSIGERMARLGEGSSRREGSPGRTESGVGRTESSDAEGYTMVELVRPTPDTKLGLTFGEFRGQVMLHVEGTQGRHLDCRPARTPWPWLETAA